MEELRRWAPIVVIVAGTLALHRGIWVRLKGRARWWAAPVLGFASLWTLVMLPVLAQRGIAWIPTEWVSYLTAGSLIWVSVAMSWWAGLEMGRPGEVVAGRRELLRMAAPLAAAPVAAIGYGVYIANQGMRRRVVDVRVKGLSKDLNGLRIAQLTDIHYGPFLGAKKLERAVELANEARPHLTVLTGDLITRSGDDLEGCLRVLRGLKAEAGVYGCHGNHEVYACGLSEATRLAGLAGFRMLRGTRETLRFGGAYLNLAGTDYQKVGQPYLVGAEELVAAGAFNLMLQHNPDAFERAEEAGFELMLSGHTHGGQINFELLGENVNVVRFFTPYVRGHYQRGRGQLYVSSGLGTVGMPVRIGAEPEVTVIRLCGI